MGVFNWILGRKRVDELARGRGWTTDVVGELQFQDNLLRQYRSHGGTEHDAKAIATLVPEENNKHDANAVRVDIADHAVGYLSRDHAHQYRSAVGGISGRCSAKIVGGFDLEDGTKAFFGVKLNISWPPRFRN
jgi:hypothetical protein